MKRRARHIAALAGCVAGASGLAALVGSGDELADRTARPSGSEIWVEPGTEPSRGDSRRRRPEIVRLSSDGPGAGWRGARMDGIATPAYLRRHRPQVEAVGRRFMEAYFAYETDGGDDAARHVRALASGPLAARLLAGAARLPAVLEQPPARARVAALDVEFDKPPQTAVVRGEVQRGGDRSGIGLVLVRKREIWTVVEVIE